MAIAGLSRSFLLGPSRSFLHPPRALSVRPLKWHIALLTTQTPHPSNDDNSYNTRMSYCPIHGPEHSARHLTRHFVPLSTRTCRTIDSQEILQKAKAMSVICCVANLDILYWRHLYYHAPHVCLESSLSLPAGSLLCGLNSRWVAMTGHTIGGGQFDNGTE